MQRQIYNSLFSGTFYRRPKLLGSFLIRKCSNQGNLTIVAMNNGVKQITLNNPKKRNALSSAMLDKLRKDVFDDVQNTNLRCIILQSNGPVFSSGHDLKELSQSDEKTREDIFKKCSEFMVGLRNVPVPVIGVVNGLAAAAGCQLIASCDITIASTKSQFSTPGASVGLFCSTPGVAVSRNVPLKIASYMLFTGNNLNANDAVKYGLISRAVEEQDLDKEVEEVIQSILCKSRSVLALGKKFFYNQLDKKIEEAYSIGSDVMVKNLAHKEAKEGIEAFFQKRPPTWSHD
ncbi:enoyl-CoA hydratase domain-containing protein 3, mitochondrial [Trichonephila inaurata madagascariensis]|uniref:Enoyl-CoA hydratase domain-containing protein 3, mitochondrial n=1 Tax=Trichonephila inaurata madagascariensis TaxID=2747483 RepID=A0A8X6YG70_9ARAC|nr:enoyl-CoA hydratase domain-containing protein 3, mitochondrial [Trichonephila inaurata madagascariensis]